MPVSVEDICNKALLRVGHTAFITSLTVDQTTEADVCNRCYQDCLDEVLSEFWWPFTTRRWLPAQLNPASLANGVVPTGWTYAYAMPPDIITLRSIVPSNPPQTFPYVPPDLVPLYTSIRDPREDQATPFGLEYDSNLKANILLTDANAPEWIYTAEITDPNLMDVNFRSALSWRLAVELGAAIRKDAKVAAEAQVAYNAAVAKAAASAKRGVRPDQEPVPSWIAARGG